MDDARQMYLANCKQYKWEEQLVYRGIESINMETAWFTDPSKSERKSRNTSNFYTLWIDNSKKWSTYPKRSKSLICSTSLSTASEFGDGDSFMVIPFDGAKIGVCPSYDMWDCFYNELTKLSLYTLPEFNMYIWNAISTITQHLNVSKDEMTKDIKTLKKWLTDADKIISKQPREAKKRLSDGGWDDDVFESIIRFGNLTKIMDMVLDPQTNGFKVMPFKNFEHASFPNKEVWTDSPCILIPDTADAIEQFDEWI